MYFVPAANILHPGHLSYMFSFLLFQNFAIFIFFTKFVHLVMNKVVCSSGKKIRDKCVCVCVCVCVYV